jgi:hypothetical protein
MTWHALLDVKEGEEKRWVEKRCEGHGRHRAMMRRRGRRARRRRKSRASRRRKEQKEKEEVWRAARIEIST